MQFFDRSTFLSLIGRTEAQFTALSRRDQAPAAYTDLLNRRHGEYSALEALLWIIRNALSDLHLAHVAAAQTAAQAVVIAERSSEIASTSQKLAAGVEPKSQILFARLLTPGDKGIPKTVFFCGTVTELAKKYPAPIVCVVVNVSRAAAELRARADNAGVSLDDFWSGKWL